MSETILEEIQNMIKKNQDLEQENYNLKLTLEKLSMRERLYQSELTKTRNNLQKLAQSIDISPHSNASEYQKYYESEKK